MKAQFALGTLYHFGNGVPQDYAAARGWYKKAATQGDAMAQHALGLMYADGHRACRRTISKRESGTSQPLPRASRRRS